MTVVSFPEHVKQVAEGKAKLEDWPWDEGLGKPTDMSPCDVEPRDINGPIEDKINPAHYKQHGVECIELTENMGFLDGNIVKYAYRYAMKGGVEDLDKCDWYLQRLRKKLRHR